jgi:hypothetical protein
MIRTIAITLACIFKYPEAVNKQDFKKYLIENDFTLKQPKKEILLNSDRVVGTTIIADKYVESDMIRIIYNSNANLTGYPATSFITVMSTNFEKTFEVFKSLVFKYVRDRKLDSEIVMYEATFTGFIEKDNLIDSIRKYFMLDNINRFGELLGQESLPVGFRVKGINPTDENWFDLLIDTSFIAQNPKLSFLRLVMRYRNYENFRNLKEIVNRIADEVILDAKMEENQ